MTKIELTIAPNYVPTWGIVEAIRELFQNALDQEVQCPGNTMDWGYDSSTQTFKISNKTSKLEAGSLLLGASTKTGDVSTIGQFGEGYKIATLVLLRNNKQITFYNYAAREIWRPRFVKSRRFGTDVLTFFIEKVSVWKQVPDADLTIEVQGITPEEFFEEIKPSNLHIIEQLDGYEVIEESQYGRVINLPGKVYVNGLYVCDYTPYQYGYDFKPEYIDLDRDRKMVSDFDLRWSASRIWARSKSSVAIDLIEQGAADVAYVNSIGIGPGYTFNDEAFKRFRDVYGPEAVPVTTQAELENVPSGYRGVIVPEVYSSAIRRSVNYVEPKRYVKSPQERLEEFFEELNERYSFTEEEIAEFERILEDL